jgi:ABC-type branched-subunit amino acid transport system ATPase component
VIDVRHLTKTYGSFKAVDDFSFRVRPGEVVGLIGPNGAGRASTLILLPAVIVALVVAGECWIAIEGLGRVLNRTEPSAVEAVEQGVRRVPGGLRWRKRRSGRCENHRSR